MLAMDVVMSIWDEGRFFVGLGCTVQGERLSAWTTLV